VLATQVPKFSGLTGGLLPQRKPRIERAANCGLNSFPFTCRQRWKQA